MQLAVAPGNAGRHRQAHGHPVIGLTVDHGAVQRRPTRDRHAVLEFLEAGAHGPELAGHDREPIGFLDPQLGGITDAAGALGTASGHSQHGDLIDQARDQLAADLKSPQRAVDHAQIAHWFAGHIAGVEHLQPGAHELEHIQNARDRCQDIVD